MQVLESLEVVFAFVINVFASILKDFYNGALEETESKSNGSRVVATWTDSLVRPFFREDAEITRHELYSIECDWIAYMFY